MLCCSRLGDLGGLQPLLSLLYIISTHNLYNIYTISIQYLHTIYTIYVAGDLGGLEPGHPTLASLLRARHYRTYHIGKWHLGVGLSGEFLPTRRGCGLELRTKFPEDCAKLYKHGH